MNKKTKLSGFTLVELLVVISIIGILSGIFLNRIGDFRDRAEDARRIADIRHIQTVLELYYNTCRSYPLSDSPTSGCVCGGTTRDVRLDLPTLLPVLAQLDGLGKPCFGIKSLPDDPDAAAGGAAVKHFEYGSDGDGYTLKATLNKNNNPETKNGSRGVVHGVNCGTAALGSMQKEYCVEF